MIDEAYRGISIDGFSGKFPRPAILGEEPSLVWLPIKSLRVDSRYQREIGRRGAKNIGDIAVAFTWQKFAPVIVATIPSAAGYLFAIIDGQHRATAALLIGIERVPCYIVHANPEEQAAAFKAINANVTRVHLLQTFAAAVAAGEPEALAVTALVAAAGVTFCRTPKSAPQMRAGQSLAVDAVVRSRFNYGDAATVAGLVALVASANGRTGLLRSPAILGACQAMREHVEWQPLAKRAEDIDIALILDALPRGRRAAELEFANLFAAEFAHVIPRPPVAG